MALGIFEDGVGNCVAMDGCAPNPRTTCSASWMGRPSRPDLSPALRQLPRDRTLLAGAWCHGATDHVEADPCQNSQRILGQALESRVPPTGLHAYLSAAASTHRPSCGGPHGVRRLRTDSRPRHLSAGSRRIWPSPPVFFRAGTWRHSGTLEPGQTTWAAERTRRMDVSSRRNRGSGLLVISSAVCAADNSAFHARNSRRMKNRSI